MKLEIGQPVYLLAKKEGEIIPAIVCEQKSILGSKTPVWTIMIGPMEIRKLISSDKFGDDYEIVTSLYELRDALFKQAALSVTASLNEAVVNMKKWYTDDVGAKALEPALKIEKQKSNFTDAKNMSFKDIAGKSSTEDTSKKRGRKKKIELEPVVHEQEELAEETEVEPEARLSESVGNPDDPNFKVKYIDDNGNTLYLTLEELQNRLE